MAVDLDVWGDGHNREPDIDASARERSNKSIYSSNYVQLTRSNRTKKLNSSGNYHSYPISYICQSYM